MASVTGLRSGRSSTISVTGLRFAFGFVGRLLDFAFVGRLLG
jgi:hypothetical protein